MDTLWKPSWEQKSSRELIQPAGDWSWSPWCWIDWPLFVDCGLSALDSTSFTPSPCLLPAQMPWLMSAISAVIEVKCPMALKTVNRYVTDKGVMVPKVRAQLQLQMLAAGASKGLLCVADPEFESNSSIIIVDDELDLPFIEPILERAERFWAYAILPILLKR